MLDFEGAAPQLANPSSFRELHIIWIFVGLNVLYVISNIYFILLDKKSNFGNVEHAKLHDIKEGYKALERISTGEDSDERALPARIARSSIQVWRVRLYIFLCGVILLATWISFGVVMGYRRS
jgi:hypothetical protein